jgi:hypothetical protein
MANGQEWAALGRIFTNRFTNTNWGAASNRFTAAANEPDRTALCKALILSSSSRCRDVCMSRSRTTFSSTSRSSDYLSGIVKAPLSSVFFDGTQKWIWAGSALLERLPNAIWSEASFTSKKLISRLLPLLLIDQP